MDDEQEKCKRCKGRKFDRPKKKCTEPDFHWLMAGREWQKDAEEGWVAVETQQSRRTSYDGLLVHGDLKQQAQTIAKVTFGNVTLEAKVIDGEVKLVRVDGKPASPEPEPF